MACDTAFRIVARRHLDSLNAHCEAAAKGDPNALHQMRVALTHLRTAILFFSPMVEDAIRDEIRDELKWLNGELGAVRDLDVAVERIKAMNGKRKPAVPSLQSWKARNAEAHQHLTRTLGSVRYRWLVDQVSAWIESGPWSTKKGKQAIKARALPVAEYSAEKLAQWEAKLLRKSGKLYDMGDEKRHRLRLLNKKLTYSIDSLEDLFTSKALSKQKAALKHLRKAQRSLGELNDAAQGDALAGGITHNGVPAPLEFLTPKRRKRLLEKAAKAYRKLDSTL